MLLALEFPARSITPQSRAAGCEHNNAILCFAVKQPNSSGVSYTWRHWVILGPPIRLD